MPFSEPNRCRAHESNAHNPTTDKMVVVDEQTDSGGSEKDTHHDSFVLSHRLLMAFPDQHSHEPALKANDISRKYVGHSFRAWIFEMILTFFSFWFSCLFWINLHAITITINGVLLHINSA